MSVTRWGHLQSHRGGHWPPAQDVYPIDPCLLASNLLSGHLLYSVVSLLRLSCVVPLECQSHGQVTCSHTMRSLASCAGRLSNRILPWAANPDQLLPVPEVMHVICVSSHQFIYSYTQGYLPSLFCVRWDEKNLSQVLSPRNHKPFLYCHPETFLIMTPRNLSNHDT